MNKWEKEVQQSLLNDEQQVLNVLKMAYAGTLRDVQDKMSAYFARIQANPNDVSAIYQFRYQQALQDQIYNILDNLKNQNYQTISEYLEHSYENGWLGAMYDIHRQGIPVIVPINQENAVRAITINSKISVPMYTRLGTDIDRLRVSIAAEVTRGIVSGSTWHDTAARISGQTNISAYNAMRIARTEGHRVQCNAQYDACNSAKQSGADVVNQWDSTMDSRTRDTHRRLHKQLREVGQPFEIDGKKALYPGAFGIPEEDIHCRCAMLQRARWALSESELQQLRNTPEAKQLAETQNFEQFKNKYLELTENSGNGLTNSGGNGTINDKETNTTLNTKLFQRKVKYYAITDERISHISDVKTSLLSDEKNAELTQACKDLLKYMEKDQLGTEGMFIFDMNMNILDKYKSPIADSHVRYKPQSKDSIVIHNHASDTLLSDNDLKVFYDNDEIKIMGAIGHNGSLFFVEKTTDYDEFGFCDYMRECALDVNLPIQPNAVERVQYVEKIMEGADEYGVRFYTKIYS